MGSRGSKDAVAAPAEDASAGGGGSGGDKSRRWLRAGMLSSACFCPSSSAAAADSEQHEKGRERLRSNVCADGTVIKSDCRRGGCCLKFGLPRPSQATCSGSPCSTLDGGCQAQEGTSHAELGNGSDPSAQAAATTQTSNSLSHSCSHFGFISNGIASRLERAASLGSSGPQSIFPTGYSIQNNPEGGSSNIKNGTDEGSAAVDNVSFQDIIGSNVDTGTGVSGSSQQNLVRSGNLERRPSRRHRPQEPLEGSIRFSRTLSVGRLRDRVLRGPSFSDRFFGPASLEDGLVESHDNGTGRRALHQAMGVSSENSATVPSHPTSMSYSMDNSHNHVSETPHLREVTNGDILEHRSAFIERRRRIRSQVRALQQLGNRVENFPGHDRSCILSGQHRTGHCQCRRNNRPQNLGDGRNARSSISRIVMLAEALFEVLDEIHQQAVVLASRPSASASSIGSVPAPKEAVERMPLRIYRKPQKHHNEEAAQCYICLVEYEEGDYVRTLPCNHEFHRICVDKWLKEIHRVCPLCRGDVCISDLPSIS